LSLLYELTLTTFNKEIKGKKGLGRKQELGRIEGIGWKTKH